MEFTHLHVHSHYSLLDGLSKVEEIVDKCISTGMNAVALTDHGNMYGIKDLLDYCKKVNEKREAAAKENGEEFVPFKPIVGTEAYCARRGRLSKNEDKAVNPEGRTYVIDRSGWHLILLAKNIVGYHNLCRLVSHGFMSDAFYHTPRIDKELLEKWHEGIICCSACLGGELPQKVLEGLQSGDMSAAEETVQWFKNLFGEDYYIELQRHETQKPGADVEVYERQKQVNPVLIDLAHKYNVKLIATNDSHFVNEEDAEAHDRLICLSTNHFVNDVNRMHYTKQEWLKTPEEMAEIFGDIPEALSNTQEIVNKVEIYDIDHGPIMPKFDIPASFGKEEDYPVRSAQKERRVEDRTVLLLRCGNRFAIRKRPGKGLLAGLWEFPNLEGLLNASSALAAAEAMGASVLHIAPCGEAKHIFTHVEWRMTGYLLSCAQEAKGFLWLTPEEIGTSYSVPTAFRFWQKKLSSFTEDPVPPGSDQTR